MKNTARKTPESIRYQEGKMSSAAYDTAWAARVTDESGKSLFPECVQWLLENQKPNGSWGSQVVNYHDRLISTLSAIMALKELDEGRYGDYIRKGEAYVWKNMRNLELESIKLVGSELLIPSLMEQAESMGLDLPYHVKIYQREYHTKLSKIDESLWYSPMTTLSHSLEFLGDRVDADRLSGILLPNGCVGNSPAATAFFLKHRKDAKAFMFLKKTLRSSGDCSVTTVYPINVFEFLWTTYNLMVAGLYFERYSEICDFLRNYLGRSGVGMSTEFPIPDADDTSVLCKILYEMQYPVDFSVLEAYDTGDYYATYTFELDPSVSTNIHVLDCVRSCRDFPDREEVMEKLVQYLKREMNPEGFWIDKWHISPYYTTSHAVLALCDVDPSLAEKAVSWILDTQNENGMWGYDGGTLEETALALQALFYYHQKVGQIDMDNMLRTLPRLDSTLLTLSNAMPELWIGKVLYCPVNIVFSSVIGASAMHNTTVWKLCSGWSV